MRRKPLNIIEIEERTPELTEKLLSVWESAVRATHLFLSPDAIETIKAFVPQALAVVPRLIVAEDDGGCPLGFLGISEKKVEMLFIADEYRSRGIGSALLGYGIEQYGVNDLAVNEQNPLAKGFYEHLGFIVYKRTEFDEQGNAYPLLYMKRS